MPDRRESKEKIRAKIVELAKSLDRDASGLHDDDVIPQARLLDSAELMMLIVWYEDEFGVSTEDEELTIDNFGSINLMSEYLHRHR